MRTSTWDDLEDRSPLRLFSYKLYIVKVLSLLLRNTFGIHLVQVLKFSTFCTMLLKTMV